MSEQKNVTEAAPQPCKGCPWLLENHGKRHPDGWYTKANRNRLWSGLRNGGAMTCHPTDPDNEVSDQAQAKGYRQAPEHAQTRECTGGQLIQQREFQILDAIYRGDLPTYLRERRQGLSKTGVAKFLQRFIFGKAVGFGLTEMDLNQPVGHHALDWNHEQIETAKAARKAGQQ